MMRTNTRKFKVLEFIGSNPMGVRYMDIERFITEQLNGRNYDQMVETRVWDYRKNTSKFAMVRRYKGVWGTNLCYGRNAILHKYCVKNDAKRWMLNAGTRDFVQRHTSLAGSHPAWTPTKSSLEAPLPSDEIKGNSVPVSVHRITIPMDAPTAVINGTPRPAGANTPVKLFTGVPSETPPWVPKVFDEMTEDELEIEAIRALKQVRKEREVAEKAFLDASAALSQAKRNVRDAEDILRKALGL
jgi:hypothetical protein